MFNFNWFSERRFLGLLVRVMMAVFREEFFLFWNEFLEGIFRYRELFDMDLLTKFYKLLYGNKF